MDAASTGTLEMDRTAIDRVREAHIAAMNNGDAEEFARVFAQNAVQMPPNAPANSGRERIRGWCQAFTAAFGMAFSLDVDEVQIAGEWAFERGRYRITLHPRAGGGAIEDNGKYITIYERQAGEGWRTARDIWNSDNPPPPMT